MGKRHISYRARDKLRQFDELREPSFMPTISVERPIIIDETVGKEYRKTIHKMLGLGLRRQQKDAYHVVKPENMCLKIVDNVPISRDSADRLVEDLTSNLLAVLDRAPQWMAMPLGRVACFTETQPRKQFFNASVVGVEPQGWRGQSARYAAFEANTQRAPISLLADESQVCKAVLGTALHTPYTALVEHLSKIPARQLSIVQQAAQNALPEMFEWQDPIIYLRTGRNESAVKAFPVRAPNVYDLAA